MKEVQRQTEKKLEERKGKIKNVQETEAGADITSTQLYDPSGTHTVLGKGSLTISAPEGDKSCRYVSCIMEIPETGSGVYPTKSTVLFQLLQESDAGRLIASWLKVKLLKMMIR